MKNTLLTKVTIFCGFIVTLYSCNLDDFDFNKLTDPSIGIGIKAPLASGSYTMGQFIENINDPDGLIMVDENDLFTIRYIEDNIFTYHAVDLVEIPNTVTPNDFNVGIKKLLGNNLPGEIPEEGISFPIIDVDPYFESKTHVIDIGNDGDEEDIFLSQIRIENAEFTVILNSDISTPKTASITLENCFKDGAPVTCTLSDQNPEQTISLAGAIIDFTGNDIENLLVYSTSIQLENNDNAFIKPDDNVLISLTINNLETQYIEGDFGQQTINIDSNTFDIGNDIFESLNGEIKFLNPSLSIQISNSIGVPGLIDFNMSSETGNQEPILLNPEHIELEIPSSEGDVIEFDNTINNSNSNIVDLISSLPADSVKYFGNVKLNHIARSNDNFITNTSLINLDMVMDIPLDVEAKDMTMTDTITLDFSESDITFNETFLRINADNHIPLAISSDIIFIDTLSNSKLSRKIKLSDFAAALTDDEGNSIEATNSQIEIALSEEDMENLLKSNAIVLDAFLNSPEQGEKPARLKSANQLDIEIKLETRATLK